MTTDTRELGQGDNMQDGNIEIAELDNITLSDFCKREGNDAEIRQLAESIRRHGLKQHPIAAKRDDGTYLVIDGRRRYLACQLLGWDKIPLRIIDVTEKEAALIAHELNWQTKSLTKKDIADNYQRFRDQFDMTQEEISEKVGCAQSVVASYLSLAELPADVVDRIGDTEESKFTFTHASTLAKLMRTDRPRREDEVRKLAEKCLDHGLNTKRLDRLVGFIKEGRMDQLPDQLQELLLTHGRMTRRMAELYLEPETGIQRRSAQADRLREEASGLAGDHMHRLIRNAVDNGHNYAYVADKIREHAEKEVGTQRGPADKDQAKPRRILEALSRAVEELPNTQAEAGRRREECTERECEDLREALSEIQRRLTTLKKALETERVQDQ